MEIELENKDTIFCPHCQGEITLLLSTIRNDKKNTLSIEIKLTNKNRKEIKR